MTEQRRYERTSSPLRLPGPDEDATPFLLRCYVKRAPFRPLYDFEPDQRHSLQQEYKLYVWRTATLRDVATLLYISDRTLSTPFTAHAFRIVYFDERQRRFVAREAAQGVTRIASSALHKALEDAIESVTTDEDSQLKERGDQEHRDVYEKTLQESRPFMRRDADDRASKLTMSDLGLQDGDILDCVLRD